MTFQTYNTNIPSTPNNPSTDQPLMTQNTNSIANLIAQDHFGYNNNAGGNHKWVHLKNTSAPGGLGANADSVFYSNVASSQAWPFWQNALGSFQILGLSSSLSPNGYFSFPGGLIVQWGLETTVASSGSTSFPLTFPSNVFSVVFGSRITSGSTTNHASSVYIKDGASFTTSGFSWRQADISADGTGFYWIAIGN